MSECVNRNYLYKSKKLRKKLGKLQQEGKCYKPERKSNEEERTYEHKKYNGSYHKAFQHDVITGELTYPDYYRDFRDALIENEQKRLANVPMDPSFQVKQTDPLGSLDTVLVGPPQSQIKHIEPPKLSSDAAAAEMVELYCQLLARDVPFTDYNSDMTISNILTYMNRPDVLNNLPDYAPKGVINIQNLFKGITSGELYGPYISQLLYLNIPMGALTCEQKYNSYPTKADCLLSSQFDEWGINRNDMINIQNTNLTNLPLLPTITPTYVYSGRSLAEIVHNDALYQLWYQASYILNSLNIKPNPGWPVYPNQGTFISGGGLPNVLSSISGGISLSMKHAWYWKWQLYRRLRPETFSLWVDNIMNNIVPNTNYNISNVLLNNPVLSNVQQYNAAWNDNSSNSYNLPLCYREGAPAHPAYPSGHATMSGACATILKILYDTNQPWSSLNLNNTRINPLPGNIVQSNSDGSSLIPYVNSDISNMTINSEINKLASNIAIGRNWAGVHYRTDAIEGLLLGEQVAVKYMEDELSAVVYNNLNNTPPILQFVGFKGNLITVKPTLCKK